MKLSIPAQLKGQDCKGVMRSLIALRKAQAERFFQAGSASYGEICVVFRVGGRGGSFGDDGFDNVHVTGSKLCCEVLLAPRDWSEMPPSAIDALVAASFEGAVRQILNSPYGEELSGLTEA